MNQAMEAFYKHGMGAYSAMVNDNKGRRRKRERGRGGQAKGLEVMHLHLLFFSAPHSLNGGQRSTMCNPCGAHCPPNPLLLCSTLLAHLGGGYLCVPLKLTQVNSLEKYECCHLALIQKVFCHVHSNNWGFHYAVKFLFCPFTFTQLTIIKE